MSKFETVKAYNNSEKIYKNPGKFKGKNQGRRPTQDSHPDWVVPRYGQFWTEVLNIIMNSLSKTGVYIMNSIKINPHAPVAQKIAVVFRHFQGEGVAFL